MILIGAPKRPPGVTIRFEVLLRSGDPVFRGEGRVVAHRIHSNGREGLEIRFTRLDSRSKALVEQVLELRKTGNLAPASMPPPPLASPALETKVPANPPPMQIAQQVRTEEEQEPAVRQVEEEPRDSTESQAVSVDRETSVRAEVVEAQASEDQALSEEQAVGEGPKQPSPVPVRVEGTADSSPAVEDVEEIEPEEELEVLDEDPTPFAPPVMLAEMEAGPTVRAPAPPSGTRFSAASVEGSEEPAAALAKLRARQGAFETPPSARDLLDRLRQRARAS
jgi:hypothetical protein